MCIGREEKRTVEVAVRGYERMYIYTDGRTDEAVMECPRGGIKGIVYTGFTESGDEI